MYVCGVTVYDRCTIGHRVAIHANSVIGQDGFGYATHAGAHHKIPQAGNVIIGDDVELGGGCAIERATMGSTIIGDGTKFADLISIGHGTTIGSHCLFVSLVGVAGSVQVGNYVVLGGQNVDKLAFALVPPLKADNRSIWCARLRCHPVLLEGRYDRFLNDESYQKWPCPRG